jgi:hypothetical protein
MMNIPTMQNPNDLYSYYPPSLYQPFGTFDDHSQWGSTDTSGNVPPPPQGPIQFHPQMYTPSPLDIPRSPFDYPPPPHHAYPHYHPGFTPSTFPGPPSTGTSAFDMSWNSHNLSMQQMQVAPQQMTPIGGGPTSNKKTVYDEYPASGVGDMLAQHMNSVDLGSNVTNDETHNYDNGTNDSTQNVNVLSSKEQQQHYQSNSTNLSLSSRPSQAPSSSSSSGPKSYASVVSSDTINANNNKSTASVPNVPIRTTVQSSTNERNNTTSNFSNDSNNSRSNTNIRGNNNINNNNNTNNYSQQTRNGAGGYNSRNQQQQQQQQSSASGGFLNWTNSSLPSNSRGNNTNTSSTYYNSASSNYYDRSSYSQQQQQQPTSASSNINNKRQNSNYQQNYSSSRTTNNMSNGNATASTIGQQPISAANQEILDALKRNHQYNPKDFNLNPKGARFFVIKSVSKKNNDSSNT